jgi:glycosyltransferase involved in cell wall biosynthesis
MLSLGRLVPYKRVDIAIGAAERLGVRLVVAGDGPERARLEGLGGSMTEFVGPVSEDEGARLMASCRLFVFCGEEDFGIAPVEANAHGAPVVAYGRGGVLETMQPGVTAEFFYEQTTEAATRAVERALDRHWDLKVLQQNAARFGSERFHEAFAQCVTTVLESR